MNYELVFHRDQSQCIFFHKSCRLALSWAAMTSEEALGRYLGRLLDFGITFWTISGTVFCGYHRRDVWNQFMKHFFGSYLK